MFLQIAEELARSLGMRLADDKERKRRSLQVDQLALKHDRRVALMQTVEEVYGELLCEAPSKGAVAAKKVQPGHVHFYKVKEILLDLDAKI